jgi:hypothetical protein
MPGREPDQEPDPGRRSEDDDDRDDDSGSRPPGLGAVDEPGDAPEPNEPG